MALFLILSVGWALFWLIWRAYQVIQTPNEVLVEKLGLDIPPAPELVLEEILPQQIRVSWKQHELSNSIYKHVIHINGQRVGDTKRTETSASISNLKPGSLYTVRVSTVSAAGFQTLSQPLCVRTSGEEGDHTSEENSPVVQACHTKPVPSIPLLSPTAPPREVSQTQRNRPGPRSGTISGEQDESSRSISEDEAECDFAQLQQRFQKIQRNSEAAESQISKEEQDHDAAVRRLEHRRDELKLGVKERDEASNDLRRQVHKLESANRTAQNERMRKEKALQQKENQRRKRRDEAAKWEVQIATMTEEMNGIETQKKALQKRTASSIAETRQNIADEQKEVKSVEEDNRERSAQIRALEEERRRLNFEDETEESRETDRLEQEKDRQRRETLYKLGINYASLTNALQHAKMEHDMVKERLSFLQRVRSASIVYHPPPHLDMDLSRQSSRQRRPRQKSSLTSNRSSPAHLTNLDAFGSPRVYSSTNTSPTFGSGTTFFSSTNGMTLHGPPDSNMTLEEVEALTAGGPMSPRADSLLPANLLGDESADDMPKTNSVSPHPSTDGARTRFNSIAHTLPEGLQDRASPQSSTSRSASVLTSPHQSMHELPDFDPETSSVGPIDKNSSGPHAPRNFVSGIFGFSRQRGKTEEAPVLGSLKSGETQSFPRNYGESLDPLARRRRSYAGNWAAPVTNLFPRNLANDKDGGISRLSSSRRGFPNLFSSAKVNPPFSSGYDQFGPRNNSQDFTPARSTRDLSLSRPSSVYSFDRLPRPSTDSQPFGWGAPERSALRGSSLASDWTKWSQSPSRRPSTGFGSNSNLSLQPATEEAFEDSPPMPLQAPIGTRPTSSQQANKPILNPAAPSFTTLFARKDKGKDGKGKEGREGKDREKGKDGKDKDTPKERKEKDRGKDGKERKSKEGRDKDKGKESKDSEKKIRSKESHTDLELPANGSPPVSRKSKDSRNAPSITESRESLDRITTGTLSDTPLSKDATKPTFIQKITRKSSSTKFNSWKDKGNIFSRKGEPSTPGEVDEDVEVQLLGRSLESTSTTPSGDRDREKPGRSSLSWAFMRKSKRGDKLDLTTSEVSESSERASETGERASEAGDEEGERASLVA